MEIMYEYEIIWYGEGRTITQGPYPTEGLAKSATATNDPPLQRWRIVKKVYRLAVVETVDEGFGRTGPSDD